MVVRHCWVDFPMKMGGKINEREKKIILILMYPNEKLDASQI